MANEDATILAVFNGEIYNADRLRERLRRRGHRFASRCDTEVIVHLFEEHGPDLVHELDGVFGLVVYDARTRTLFGARDPFGVKPLYYALSAARFAFASEPKALLALPNVSSEPRMEQLPAYLAFNCVPGPRTLHRDISKLEAGCRFEVSSDGAFSTDVYWSPPKSNGADTASSSLASAAANLERVLGRAVEKRLISDVPVGATLSGGFDTSLVVALLTETVSGSIPTFTIGYPGDERDPDSDLLCARTVARHLGTDHHELILGPEALEEVLDDLAALADDPIGAPTGAAIHHLARSARAAGVTVLQVAEGGDELFAGYRHAGRLDRLHRHLACLKGLVSRPLALRVGRALEQLPPRLAVARSPLGSYDGSLAELLRRHAAGERAYWGHGILFCPPEQRQLFGAGFPWRADAYEPLGRRIAQRGWLEQRPYADQLALIDVLLELPERLLMRIDRATMRHGVEARVPFLDPDLLALAFATPAALRREKAPNRACLAARIPKEVLQRRKRGFPASTRTFLSPAVLGRVRESVLAPGFLDATRLDPERLRGLVAACEARPPSRFHQLWSIYVLSLWFRHWV